MKSIHKEVKKFNSNVNSVLSEGTWNLPTKQQYTRATSIVSTLNKLKSSSFDIFGDDEFQDSIDSAINRATELIKMAKKEW